MLLGRLRDPRIDWHQLAAATNPAHPKHWLRMRILADPRRELITIRGNKFLSPEYMAMLGDLPDTAAGRRLGRGEWAAAEGVIWLLPDDQVKGPGDIPFKRTVAGIDWGFVHAFACEVIGQTGGGSIKVVDEVYERGHTVGDLVPLLQEMRRKWDISTFYADPSEPGYIVECQRAGLPVVAANNDVLIGIDNVAAAIKDGMTVDPKCQGLLGEMPGYTWMPDRHGGLKEKPIEVNDDACDALRYGVMALRSSVWQGSADVAVA
jgi:phage terminase large subunit